MRLVSYLGGSLFVILAFANPALAQGAEAAEAGFLFLSTAGVAALGIAIAAFGGALGQSRIIATALESISRNPGAAKEMFLPWILGTVFVETLVIFTFLICLFVL